MRNLETDIVERLYDGIADPLAWYAALQGLCHAAEGAVFHHVAWNRQTQSVVASMANDVHADKVREYELHHAPDDPRIPIVMAMPVGGILFDHEHFSARAMSRTAIYADWLVPLGYRHTLGMPVYDDGTLREWLCVIREVDQPAFGEGERALLHRLMPDMLRASRLRTRLADLALQAALGMAALDALPQPVALADAGGLLHYANPAAQRLLGAGQGWSLSHGRVCAAHPAAQAHLEQGIACACRRTALPHRQLAVPPLAASTIEMPAPFAGAVLQVLPLHPSHPLARWHGERPHALLAWGHGQTLPGTQDLVAMLGLTPTEASLALMLAQGLSLKHFAQAQGCTWQTARTHARNLLHKTGLHRQAQVMALVHSLARGGGVDARNR